MNRGQKKIVLGGQREKSGKKVLRRVTMAFQKSVFRTNPPEKWYRQ